MKLHVLVIISLFVFFGFKTYSQNNLIKTVIDSKTKRALEYVFINSDDQKLNLITNKTGQVIIINNPKIKSYSFYKIGYLKKTVSLENLLKADSIFLVEKPIDLQEITVTSRVLETIVKDKRFYVDDYKVLPNYDFLIITSTLNTKEFDVSYYKSGNGITYTQKIKNEMNGNLFLDCFKNIHLVTDNFSRQLLFNSDSTFEFLPKYSKAKFDSTLALSSLNIDTQIVFKSYRSPINSHRVYFDNQINSPFLNYSIVSKHHRKYLYSVFYSKALREMLLNEDQDVKRREIMKIAIGSRPDSQQCLDNEASLFYSKIAKPIYAPIFSKNDTIIIFNFQDNLIVFFNTAGEMVKEVKIDKDDFSTYRDFEIICDQVTKKFYFKTKEFDKSILSLIDIHTGKQIKKFHLEKIFAKNIQILNDKVYYLVRETEWDDTSYLYQQSL